MPDDQGTVCRACGGSLESRHSNARYCSPACRAEGRRAIARRWRAANQDLANLRSATWYQKNLERERKKSREYARTRPQTTRATRDVVRLRKHGMSKERFDEILAIQGGCGVCGRTEATRWHVDHDHRHCPGPRSCPECLRGILCPSCNAALGILGDDLEGLMRAVDYLYAHEVANPPAWLQLQSIGKRRSA